MEPSEPTLQDILQLMSAYQASQCLWTGVQLKLFTHISDGHCTAGAVAEAAGCSLRAVEMLLNALAVLRLLRKEGDAYALSPLAAQYLSRTSSDYMGYMMESNRLPRAWQALPEVVKSGRPFQAVEEQDTAEDFFPRLVRSLHIMNREPARRAAKALGAAKASEGWKILDIACGSGIWGITFAEAHPGHQVSFQDYPKLLDVTREYVTRHGLEDRSSYLPGDLRDRDYGEEQYDLVILGNILHSEGQESSRRVLEKLCRALRRGGSIAIIEMVPEEGRTGPPMPVIFALNMLVNTEEGNTYTLSEYTAWLKEAGCDRVETHDIGSHSPMITGRKPV